MEIETENDFKNHSREELIEIINTDEVIINNLLEQIEKWKKLAQELDSDLLQTKELFEDPYIKQIGVWKHIQRLEEENNYLNKQLTYAKEQYTMACLGEKSAGLSEFELTLDAIQVNADPKTYIEEANREISEK